MKVLFHKGNINPMININTIFGGEIIWLDTAAPVKIIVNFAFAEATMPDGNKVQFGNVIYQSKNYKADWNSRLIEDNVVLVGGDCEPLKRVASM
jgi:hypothetical protein